jgi:uncharacterized protein (TIGR00251 family)
METWLKNHQNGTVLLLYIQPGASSTMFSGLHGDRLKVKIKAPPQDGEANQALQDYFSSVLKIAKSKVFLIRGESSRHKDLLVELSIEKVSILMKEILK